MLFGSPATQAQETKNSEHDKPKRFLDRRHRTVDQMMPAARSDKQNIVEAEPDCNHLIASVQMDDYFPGGTIHRPAQNRPRVWE